MLSSVTSHKHILIRADANTQMGIGHLMRCLAIAQAWQANGGNATFLSACESDALRQRVASAGIGFIPLERAHPDSADLGMTLAQLERLDSSWLVVDGYHFDPAYQQSVRTPGYRLLVIDDTAHLPYYHADVLLNQNIKAERLAYRYDPDTLLLLGTSYALLRPEFLSWRGWHRCIRDVARQVLVMMGGGDPDNVTMKVIQALQQVDIPDLKAKIVVGPANPHLEILCQAARSSGGRIEIMADVSDMPELMAWADVAVSAGGSTCLELAFMGLPTVVLVVAHNQRETTEGLQKAGAAVSLGWHERVDGERITDEITALCRDPDQRRELSQNGRRLVDGRGTERLLGLMLELDAPLPNESRFTIRPATLQDTFSIWRLANDPVVRENSFNPEHIPLDHHLAWYKSKLASDDTLIWVMELGGVIAAQVRYDRMESGAAEIEFSVVPAFRGRGLGTKMLQLTWKRACNQLEVERVRGVVHKSNVPSARAFLKSGFNLVCEDNVNGLHCHIFERECCRGG